MEEDKQVVAYFSILASQLYIGDARIYRIDKIPIVLLGRMGVDKNLRILFPFSFFRSEEIKIKT